MPYLEVPEPGAIYTVGANYRAPGEAAGARPERPLIFGKAATAIARDGDTLSWDRSITDNVDAEVELGVVIGEMARNVAPRDALRHDPGRRAHRSRSRHRPQSRA